MMLADIKSEPGGVITIEYQIFLLSVTPPALLTLKVSRIFFCNCSFDADFYFVDWIWRCAPPMSVISGVAPNGPWFSCLRVR